MTRQEVIAKLREWASSYKMQTLYGDLADAVEALVAENERLKEDKAELQKLTKDLNEKACQYLCQLAELRENSNRLTVEALTLIDEMRELKVENAELRERQVRKDVP